MIVHHRKKKRQEIDIPLTSLIDMVFLLLIYFMLTTNYMVDEGIKVNLPNAKAAAPQTDEVITIYVNESGTFFLGSAETSSDLLFDKLKAKIGSNDDRIVVVKADRSAVLKDVVTAMDVAKAAGASRLSLATEKQL